MDCGSLQQAIEDSMTQKDYQAHAPLVVKVIQLGETFSVRFFRK